MHVLRTLHATTRARRSRPATLVFLAVLALLLFLLLAAAPRTAGAHVRSRVLTSFAAGAQFPESMAALPGGRLAVSVTDWGPTQDSPNTGRVYAIDRGGRRRALSPELALGGGLLTGVVVDRDGAVYVGHATYDGVTVPGVFRIAHFRVQRVADLPVGSFPNGLALRRGVLYVSDSTLGAIWRVVPGRSPVQVATSSLLTPTTADGLGANGIAFHRDALYVAVSERGTIVRIPWRHGRPGTARVVARSAQLAEADGVLFGRHGALYVTSNANDSIARVTRAGHVTTVATAADGLLYPTALAWAGRPDRSALDVLSGDFDAKGRPTLVELALR